MVRGVRHKVRPAPLVSAQEAYNHEASNLVRPASAIPAQAVTIRSDT